MASLSLILSWVLFPLVLAGVGAGWGVLVERASGSQVAGALAIPLGLAAAIVLSSLLTAWSVSARAAIPVVAAGALVGLFVGWPERRRLALWPALAARRWSA